jgi:hypothetical protein
MGRTVPVASARRQYSGGAARAVAAAANASAANASAAAASAEGARLDDVPTDLDRRSAGMRACMIDAQRRVRG